jgi:hypothetical protein
MVQAMIGHDSAEAHQPSRTVSNSAMTANKLDWLLYAWRVAQFEGPQDDPDARRFEYLLKVACLKGDVKFLGQLARAFKKDTPSPKARKLKAELDRALAALDIKSLEEWVRAWQNEALGKLAEAWKKELPRPWLPQTALQKVRLCYVSFDHELHPSWDDVKELAIELYPELRPIKPRHWQRLRAQAGLSGLPGRGRGRPKKVKGKAKNTPPKIN